MKVIAHRGYWKSAAEQNTVPAFARAFALGFGVQTDVRDCAGQLVVSHELPAGGDMAMEGLLHLAARRALPLALNVRSDGIARPLADALRSYRGQWFVVGMSVPEMRAHLAAGNPVYTRVSDIETRPVLFDACTGVWLDAFDSQWYGRAVIEQLLGRGKEVCIVSPELHGRDPGALWASLRPLAANPRLMLCTSEPELAQQHFSTAATQPG
jgi:hypothetical protein